MTEQLHSRLGASSAERWMTCPGSVALIESLGSGRGEDPDYTKEGTAAHEVLAHCMREGEDAWECTTDAETATAIQTAIDVCRSLVVPHGQVYIEHRLSSSIHPDYGGTVDFACVADSLLSVVDYKHGVGIPVEVDHNPQAMYYAFGILDRHPNVQRVALRIVQPRCPHPDGPVRRCVMAADELRAWVRESLVPAMERTAVDDTLVAGSHCRFCPAKLVCPLMRGLFQAAHTTDPSQLVDMTDDLLGKTYQLVEPAQMYLKAVRDEVSRRVMSGRTISGAKLVNKKSDRVYKDGAYDVFWENFGETALDMSLKSPAQMEKISADAKKLVREWAYQPQTGYTVAPEGDKRREVKLERSSDVFAGYQQDVADGAD